LLILLFPENCRSKADGVFYHCGNAASYSRYAF
jgi:hypothetical protein